MPPTAIADHRPPASSRGRQLVGAELERCILCNGTKITREGKRYKKLETVQLWYCHTVTGSLRHRKRRARPIR